MVYDYLIVGAGFSGSVFARKAAELNKSVLLVDKKNHVGGNAFDYINKDGLFVQKYGPHIFHTNSKEVWNFLSKYTEWNNYVHRVLIDLGDKKVYLPINIDTMERLYDRNFSSEEMRDFLTRKKIDIKTIKNSKDVILSQVGEELYKLFFENYTKKQWGIYPDELESSVLKRIPVRFNRDTRYFEDKYQGIPKMGFNVLFDRLLFDENITVELNTDYQGIINSVKYKKMIYTGPIDSFFGYKYGKLPYRSLNFDIKLLDTEYFQSEAVVNYPNHNDYTRITEFKYFYKQKNKKTIICHEYAKASGEPFYPIPKQENNTLYMRYKKLAEGLENVHFLGRLAEYKYINMDKATENAFKLSNTLLNKKD
jgi:UDP-galactopyranose mutase